MRKLLPFTLSVALGACAVGPDYTRPDVTIESNYARLEAGFDAGAQPESRFWSRFGDAQLDRLVEAAFAANHDLRIAAARLASARSQRRATRLDLFPTVTTEAGRTKARLAQGEEPGVPRRLRDSDLYDAQFDAFWELDLWGRVRRGVEAASAETDAAAADLRAAQVSVIAEVVRTYVELRGRQEQLKVAKDNAVNQAATLNQVEIRLDAGRGTDFDAERARAQLYTTQSRIPALQAAIGAAEHRLAVLIGREPTALIAELDPPAAIPVPPASVAVGVPGELLKRRPDIQSAERHLAAATARIGVAQADFFPRITFGGFFGSKAGSTGDLFERASESYAFGPAISWPFLDFGRVDARFQGAKAEADASLAQYQQTVLRAAEETENALLGYARVRSESDKLAHAADSSAAAAKLARIRFDGGMTDFLQVLDAERTQLDAEDHLADSRTRSATALVALYKSLAGGWETESDAAKASAIAAPSTTVTPAASM
jgi:multidrug efflux system outer membrane protein